jgi:hypothetical protein
MISKGDMEEVLRKEKGYLSNTKVKKEKEENQLNEHMELKEGLYLYRKTKMKEKEWLKGRKRNPSRLEIRNKRTKEKKAMIWKENKEKEFMNLISWRQ